MFCLDRYDDQFVVANFDSAPTADSEIYSKLNTGDRDEHEQRVRANQKLHDILFCYLLKNYADSSKHRWPSIFIISGYKWYSNWKFLLVTELTKNGKKKKKVFVGRVNIVQRENLSG